jgi:type IX secretion system PorP/SprF family membrane protein
MKTINYNPRLFVVLFFWLPMVLSAQQDPQYSHYMYNTLSVNPAYAGSRGAMAIGLLHRQQWIGLDGAPMTQTFLLHTPLKFENMALGGSIVHDEIGPTRNISAALDYSYSVDITRSVKLAFGVKARADMLLQQFGKLTPFDPGDQALTGIGSQSFFSPNIGAGIYLHHERWYVGLSAPRLLESKFDFTAATATTDVLNFQEKRHYFGIAGLIIPITGDVKLKPTVLVKSVSNSPYSIDATVETLYLDRFSLGLGGRIGDSFYAMLGCMVNDQLRVGVAYDYSYTRLRKVNDGSLELSLGYDFNYNRKNFKTPRYF